MDFKQIEAFVNVIKYKGFSKAAEATFLTQPTISAHINSLEKELRLQLIDRTKKEAIPTAEGKIFYNYALTMLNTREQAIYSLQNFSLNINGTIEIQSSSIPGEYIVPSLIAEFKNEYGKAKFHLEQSDSSLVADNIKSHKGEIGFTGHRENNGLTYKLLMKDKVVLVTPKNEYFMKRAGESLKLREFINEPFILREKGSATRQALESELESKGIAGSSMNVIARMNSMEAIKQAVRGGLGISIISEVAADRASEDSGYMVFDIEDFDTGREFYLVYDDKITMSPTSETFKFFVLEKYGYKFLNKNNIADWGYFIEWVKATNPDPYEIDEVAAQFQQMERYRKKSPEQQAKAREDTRQAFEDFREYRKFRAEQVEATRRFGSDRVSSVDLRNRGY